MAGNVQFLCKVKGGSFFPLYRDAFNQLLKDCDNEDVVVTIKKVGKRRTDKFNAYYWAAIVTPIRIAVKSMTGDDYSQEEIHGMLKQRFLNHYITNQMTGEMAEISKSTASLSQDDFKDYIEKCKKFGNDFFDLKLI